MIFPFLACLIYFNILDGMAFAPVIYLAAKIFLLAFPLFFIKSLAPIKSVFKFDFGAFVRGSTVGVLIFATGYLVLNLPFIWDIVKSAAPHITSKINSFGVMHHYLAMALGISFVHSMLEEYYWRWFVYGISGKNILSAVTFSLHHFIVLNYYFNILVALALTTLVALGGIIFNFLYAKEKNIWGAWAAHVGADLFIFYTGGLLI
jgi:membrane protease YdiL (CAAX protease family)